MFREKHNPQFRAGFSLRFKIILAFLIISSLVSGALSYSTYRLLNRNMLKELQTRVRDLAAMGSALIDMDVLVRLMRRMTPDMGEEEVLAVERSGDFETISDQLNRIRDTEGELIRYVYIFVPTGDENTALYVADADTVSQLQARDSGQHVEDEDFSHFNSVFDISEFSIARQAIKEQKNLVEEVYSYDEVFKVNSITGYAPIFDSSGGQFLAVLGLDMVDTDARAVLRRATRISLIITLTALAISVTISIVLGTFFTKGIVGLDKIVRQFDEKHLDLRVEISSRDEIGRLGVSFNQMAGIIQRYSAEMESLLGAYGRFVPQDFLRFLEKKSIVDVKLGDQVLREMTILFSDIRSFTELSELMTPEENFNFLNSYLSRVGPVIRDCNGFIDKYIGDAIMALFPYKPDDAVRSAIAMMHKVKEYNEHRKKSGYVPIGIGISLHTGKLMLGTLGEHERMDGSVISDAVNLCARIEGLTRLYGGTIIISGQTLKLLDSKDAYRYRFVDRVRVRGKKEIVMLYEIYDNDPPDIIEGKTNTKREWVNALLQYYDRDFKKAYRAFQAIKKKSPWDRVTDLYLRRCVRYHRLGVPEDWQGVEMIHLK